MLDYNENISKINIAINDLDKNSKPKIIGIKAFPRVGKSMFAEALNTDTNNCQLIDVRSLIGYSKNPIELPDLDKLSSTFIIDDADFVQEHSLLDSMKKIVDEDGVLVLVFQHINDLSDDIKNTNLFKHMKCFELSKNGLTVVETLD